MPILPAATPVQRRVMKKARPTIHLVEGVQEVVQAFEFEYAQVRQGGGNGGGAHGLALLESSAIWSSSFGCYKRRRESALVYKRLLLDG